MDLFQQDYDRIKELRRLLVRYEKEYYEDNAPTVSDQTFDQLMKELENLEAAYPDQLTPDSPTQRVGSEFISKGNTGSTHQHKYPMLSLANSYSWEETLDFYRRIQEITGRDTPLVSELKLDGVSISIIYERGVLSRALTRGDGTKGEEVTEAVWYMSNIPHRLKGLNLPEYIEVRGEILLPWAEFKRLNTERTNADLPLFANPRNAVAGTIKSKENIRGVIEHRKPIAFFYYLLGEDPKWLPSSHFERLKLMKTLGLPVEIHATMCHTIADLKKYLDHWDIHRHELPVATDGVVVKVDDYALHDVIGRTAKSPRWAMAYKFSAEKALTRLESVSYQVARTGVMTPVANLEPIQLSGTIVSRATLHNADIIAQLDLHIGDLVMVEKGGEIIPKITSVRYDLRDDQLGASVVMPSHCPDCGSLLRKEADTAGTYCPNEWGCPAQIEGKIEHFCSRYAMDINIGPKSIHLLHSLLGVDTVADMYDLSERDLLRLPNFKDQKAGNLIESIANTVSVPFDRVLYALGIRLVGRSVAQQLVSHFTSLDHLANASRMELMEVDEIGPMIADSVVAFFADERNRDIIKRLKDKGLKMALEEGNSEPKGSSLAGLNIVISGVFSTISRDELKGLITRYGGKNTSSITGKTSLVVAGENMGPSKREKAEKLGIEVIGEQDFFERYPELRKK